MNAKPLSKATAEALGELVLDRARRHKLRSAAQTGVGEAIYMRVATEDLVAILLGAVCGMDAELALRRALGDEGGNCTSFGRALRSEAENLAAARGIKRTLRRHHAISQPFDIQQHDDPRPAALSGAIAGLEQAP